MRLLILGILAVGVAAAKQAPQPQQQQPQSQQPKEDAEPAAPTNPVDIRPRSGPDWRAASFREVFAAGTVTLEEGDWPGEEKAAVQALCHGSTVATVYTRGRFSLSVGRAHVEGSGAVTGLAGCRVIASLPGFQTVVVDLSGNPGAAINLGILRLRPLKEVQGLSISMTSQRAPRNARKAYEKGLEFSRAGKPDSAVAECRKAVAAYPEYASAWYALGSVLHGIEKPGEARAAYERSIAADASYLPGSLGIVKLDAAGRRWPAVAERAGRIVRMNPVEFPEAHLYLAVAQYNLGQHESAEESARKAVELDPLHRYPKSWHLLGMLLAERGASAEAAQNLRLYLRHAPKAQDAADVQARIAALEQRR